MFKRTLVVLLGAVMFTGTSVGQQPVVSSTTPGDSLTSFLRSYLTPARLSPDSTTRINIVSVKADVTAPEVEVVYVSGQRWCGSGGCTLLIVEPVSSSFKVLGRLSVVQLPVRVLHSAKERYPSLGVEVVGGGILHGYEAEVSFDGKAYPRNPSLRPARRLSKAEGKVIISTTADSIPLYK